VAFLVGWAILRVVALVPVLGGLVWFAAVVFGLGALVVAIWPGPLGRPWRTGRRLSHHPRIGEFPGGRPDAPLLLP
jgi:hypothetical protein